MNEEPARCVIARHAVDDFAAFAVRAAEATATGLDEQRPDE
jgi:hypothetical protein